MKICIISSLYEPYIIGGAEINTERLVKALSKDKEVFVITTKPFDNISSLFAQQEVREGIKAYRFYPLNLYSIYFHKKRRIAPLIKIIWHILDLWNIHTFFLVLGILKKERPDVIHTNNLSGLSFSVFWAAKLLKIPLVHTLHDYHLLCPYATLICPYTKFNICKNRPFLCRIYSFFKKIIVDSIPQAITGPSQFVIDIHRKYGFFKKTKAQAIPNFIDIEKIDKANLAKKDEKTLDILYVGRLSKEKGVNVLIDAFRDLKENFLRLHIVGDGPENKFLKELARTDERIVLHGEVRGGEINKFYEISDILVIPSICHEVFGVVIIEAFSFGVPVIGSNIGGIKEIIQDGYNGFLFDSGNAKSLKDILKKFVHYFKSNKEILEALRRNASRSALEFEDNKVVKKAENIYNLCLKG